MQWDFINFYPSITKELEKAIEWAKQYVEFSDEDIEFIFQARKAVLIHNDEPWTKKTGDSFNVTVGSDDGAKVCELVGLYILSLLAHLTYGKAALYRDEGAMAIRGSPRQAKIKTQEVASILRSTGIGITIPGNLKVIDFLDLTFDLNMGTYKTYNKPNNTPLYVHKQSSHPPNVSKKIPLNVNNRLSSNSSNMELFEETAAPFQQALKNSGYNHKLVFEEKSTTSLLFRKEKLIFTNSALWAELV